MTILRFPRNDAAVLDQVILLDGEGAFDTTNKVLRVGDGVTLGGLPVGNPEDIVVDVDTLPFDEVTVGEALRETPSVAALGATGNNLAGDAAIVQAALDDEGTIDKTIRIPRGAVTGAYKITSDSFKMKVLKSIQFERGGTLRSDQVAGERFPALSIDITKTPGVAEGTTGEARTLVLSDGSITTNSLTTPGGNDAGGYAVEVSNDPDDDYKATKNVRLIRMNLSGGLGGFLFKGGLGAGELQWSGLHQCTTNGGVFASTDGVISVDTTSTDLYIFDMFEGAFCQGIYRGTISSPNGAIDLIDGCKTKIHDVQIEHRGGTTSTLAFGAQVIVRGIDYMASHNEFVGNNFGAGDKVDNTVALLNARGTVFDRCLWGKSTSSDLYLGDDSKDTILLPTQGFRGTRTRQAPGNYTDVSRLMVISAEGGTIANGHRGIWYPGLSVMTDIAADVASAGFEVMLDVDGRVRFNGGITRTSGAFTAELTLFRLPAWLRPFALEKGAMVCSDTGWSRFEIYPTGSGIDGLVILKNALPEPVMHFTNTGWNAVVDAVYDPNPL